MIFSDIIQCEYNKIIKNNTSQYNTLQCNTLQYLVCKFKCYNKHNVKSKFVTLKTVLLNNHNISTLDKDNILDFFSNCQRKYLNLIRFKNRFIYNKTTMYDNIYDLNYNELSSIKSKYKITIIENNKKYTFSLFDLIRIINNSLSYTVDFFSQPTDIKNPFTNTIFNYSQLYNIYTAIQCNSIKMPALFERFFISNFDKRHYQMHNEYLIQEYVINHVHLFDLHKLMRYMNNMIHFYNQLNYRNESYSVDVGFNCNELLRIFMPCIKMYILTMHSYEDAIQIENKIKLLSTLRLKKQQNPLFGRRIKCINIRKIYYISILHHKYNKNFIYLSSKFYIPPPDLIDVKRKSFFIGEYNQVSELHSSSFGLDLLNCQQLNILNIFKFARMYNFNSDEYKIINDKISHDFNKLVSMPVITPPNPLICRFYNGITNQTDIVHEYDDNDSEDDYDEHIVETTTDDDNENENEEIIENSDSEMDEYNNDDDDDY